jgi:hypothetical protein
MGAGRLATEIRVNVQRTIPEFQEKNEEDTSILMDILSTCEENQGVELEF